MLNSRKALKDYQQALVQELLTAIWEDHMNGIPLRKTFSQLYFAYDIDEDELTNEIRRQMREEEEEEEEENDQT